MTEEKYFEREYNYLQTAGEEFAKKHQALGGLLRLTEKQRKDPFVERLFEAFAFLSGRIHERLDDDIPEFAGGLLEQLFPHFLKPFPSCAILQAHALSGSVTRPVKVSRGSEVQTPVGKYKIKYKVSASPLENARTVEKIEASEFIFRTTQDLSVRPMKIKGIRVEDTSDGNSALIIHIQPNRNVNFEALELDKLQIYLNGSDSLKYTLLLYLTKYTKSIQVREIEKSASEFSAIKPFSIGIPGVSDHLDYSEDELALLPYAQESFGGYRLLHEYFSYKERFFFLDIIGLDQFQAGGDELDFEIKFLFNKKLSSEIRPALNDILINCAPIINLFERPSEEVSVSQRMPEYYMVPDSSRRKSREIYSVNNVTGVSANKLMQYSYTPITSYDVLDTADPEYTYKRFYSIVRKPVSADMAESHIRVFGESMEDEVFAKETLSINATMSNGFLPSKYLENGSISEPVSFPEGIEVKNITVPSEVLAAPDKKNFLWALLSHLTISYTTLAETETLKTILKLYNWSTSFTNSNKKKIEEGIKKVYPPSTKNMYVNRGLLRGIEFRIDIDSQNFENGEGDIHLFGLILRRFLSQYITINSFVILTFTDIETNRQYTWQPNQGKILPV
jgi:type VI secretion system protein ImpG